MNFVSLANKGHILMFNGIDKNSMNDILKINEIVFCLRILSTMIIMLISWNRCAHIIYYIDP